MSIHLQNEINDLRNKVENLERQWNRAGLKGIRTVGGVPDPDPANLVKVTREDAEKDKKKDDEIQSLRLELAAAKAEIQRTKQPGKKARMNA